MKAIGIWNGDQRNLAIVSFFHNWWTLGAILSRPRVKALEVMIFENKQKKTTTEMFALKKNLQHEASNGQRLL